MLKLAKWTTSDRFLTVAVPVSVNEAGVDIVGPLQPSDGLQAHSSGLIGHDVDQAVFKFVAWQIGTYESGRVGFGVRQTLWEEKDDW